MIEPLSPDPTCCVSASDVIRHFGEWQERAVVRPVFIMRRNRPSLVLTSFDLMRRLCAPAAKAPDRQSLLLDTMREGVMAIDGDGRVTTTNRALRVALGVSETVHDQPLSNVLPESMARFLLDLATSARCHGMTEHTEMMLGNRRYAIAVAPDGDGALLMLHDRSDDAQACARAAAGSALAHAIDMLECVTSVRINARGYVDRHSESLEQWTGIAPHALAAVRFVTLLDIGSRAAAGDAIEAALSGGGERRMTARLGVRQGQSIAVEIAFAAEREGPGIAAVRAILAIESGG